MAHQYIYTMQNLRRVHPPNKEVLKGIYLSFYPGAKIGVLGANGSGKSTLLRIMAGVDKDFFGDAKPADGIRIGYLPQEPHARPRARTSSRTSRRRWPPPSSLLTRFDEVNTKLGEASDAEEMDKLLEEQAKLQDAIEAANGWDLDRTLEIAMDALRLPPADADVTKLSGGERRRVALCKVLLERPDLLLLDEPTNHLDAESVAWLERHLHGVPGHHRGGHPRSLLPGQRRRLDPRARSRRGHPLAGQLLVLAGAEAQAPGGARRRPSRPGSARWRASWSGCAPRRAPARPSPRPVWRPTSSCWRRRRRSARRRSRSASRPDRAWATWSSRPSTCARPTATTC